MFYDTLPLSLIAAVVSVAAARTSGAAASRSSR